jgi:hypothetical protein
VEGGDNEVRFKQLSAGSRSVWAVSRDNVLYFREHMTKSFPEGTGWARVDARIKHVSVNSSDQVSNKFIFNSTNLELSVFPISLGVRGDERRGQGARHGGVEGGGVRGEPERLWLEEGGLGKGLISEQIRREGRVASISAAR